RQPAAVTRIPLPRRSAYAAEIGIDGFPGRAIEIVNLHVLAPHRPPPWRAFPHRRAQLRALEAYLEARPRPHRVLARAFSAPPRGPLSRRPARRFQDAALEAARQDGGRTAATWGPWPAGPRLFRIDHVLVAGLDVLGARVVRVAGSDHSAVVVDLALPGG